MAEYDFHIFQPAEFETFSRDILQAREGLFIESFADGRDQGIDCRFAFASNKTAIIQCKRYRKWTDLKRVLSNEVSKVTTLNPDRYILTTSCDLTAANKSEIRRLFGKYIHADSDIVGKADLNNLVNTYPEVERAHYKLWMSSTNVLMNILNNDIIGWSDMSLDQIRDELSKYVENKSFADAVKIAKENHCVIISGEPGVGKTTLARMLVIYFLEKEDYDSYVFVNNSLDEVLKVRKTESKQVIFYDDFLGRNVLENKGDSFTRQLALFVNDAKKRNCVLIVTTREYIYQEAKNKYDRNVFNEIENRKYLLKMDDYDGFIKSQIIYNHFAAAELPVEYAIKLRKNRHYHDLARHRNFNPRLIETIVKERIWESCSPEEFVPKLISFFDNPIAVWDEAFDNLSNEARYSLYILATMPTPVLIEDWKSAYFCFQINTNNEIRLQADEDSWLRMIKTLEQCFISTSASEERTIVQLANPSVFDYIVNHLKGRPIISGQLIDNAFFYEQLFHLFSDTKGHSYYSRIVMGEANYDKVFRAFTNTALNSNRTCALIRYSNNILKKEPFSLVKAYSRFLNSFSRVNAYKHYFVETNMDDQLIIQEPSIDDCLSLLEKLNLSKCTFDVFNVMQSIVEKLDYTGEVYEFIKTAKKIGLPEVVNNQDFWERAHEIVGGEIDCTSGYQECEDLLDVICDISNELQGWDGSEYCDILREKEQELDSEYDEDDYKEFKYQMREYEYDLHRLDEMFDCLCSH